MNLETQRETHPDSRAIRDLVVKSSMQASKQRSTKPENIWCWVSRLRLDRKRSLDDGSRLQGGQHTPMNSFICLRSMRCWNSRCSLALSPSLNICRQPRSRYVTATVRKLAPAVRKNANPSIVMLGCMNWVCEGGCGVFIQLRR